MTDTLERGREQYAAHQWSGAFADLASVSDTLGVDDLERLATAAYLVGRDDDSAQAWSRAHQHCLGEGDPARAVRCAFWLVFGYIQRGDMGQAGGWIGRAQGIVDEHHLDGVECGYLLVPVALQQAFSGQVVEAEALFSKIAGIAAACSDRDLATFARLGRGQCLVGTAPSAAMAILDEVMVDVTTGAVSPVIAGLAYCAVIDACRQAFDVRRAHEWTSALSRWCESQPDLVPYRGLCLVHRSQVMQLRGDWPDAMVEADRAVEWLSQPPPHPSVGAACYQRGELLRLQGRFADAEEAYRSASQWGHPVQPGLALLRLAQGDVDTAAASIRRVLGESGDVATRAAALAAYVEIMLAADDVAAAQTGADELTSLATTLDGPFPRAVAAHAGGAAALAAGEPRAALAALRKAWGLWREIDALYESARARVHIGLAYGLLGDRDSAAMELDAARWVFQELGAAPDLARLETLMADGEPVPAGGHGLTGRELEVLVHLASGKTNRAVATELVISEKTVARHVANIFMKLGLSSRSAATAYAYEHGLVAR